MTHFGFLMDIIGLGCARGATSDPETKLAGELTESAIRLSQPLTRRGSQHVKWCTRLARSARLSVALLSLTALPPDFLCAENPIRREVTEADLPRIPPTEPADAMGTFQLARGCSLQLVAAEPQVSDPVDACFDEFGRMYVAEMHGYPFSHEPTRLNPEGGGKKDAGIIRLLEDTNGDGRMDRSVVFADKISWPTSVCCYDGGLFVLAPQFLYYLKDTDGDDRADVREVVLSGFGRGNVQSLANNLKWGLDNHIYFAAGRNPMQLRHRKQPLEVVKGSDLKFDPRSERFDSVAGGLQFGHSMDDWGNRFACSNSNHIQQIVYPLRYVSRNPYLAVSRLVFSIASDGASARVFRTSPPEPWRIIRQRWRAAEKGYQLVVDRDGAWQFVPLDPTEKQGAVPTEYPVGYFTSATGITIYRGAAYPAEFAGDAFVGDVGGNLVHRKNLKSNGVLFSADRADENEEFIRSSDNWFRPVNFVNAPDGTLYVLDMYRETIEHPHSIPEEIKQFLHLQSGSNRGRIYRIVTPNMTKLAPVRLGDLSNDQLAAQLESDNMWHRETAQRLLWQRQDRTVATTLEKLATSSPKSLARLHALYTLSGLNALRPDLLQGALADPNPKIVRHAIRLSEPFLDRSDSLVNSLIALCDHADQRVRFQLAFSLGEVRGSRGVDGLVRLTRDPRNGEEIRTAVLSSVAQNADRVAAELLKEHELAQHDHMAASLSDLSVIVGTNPKPGPALRLLATACTGESPTSVSQIVLAGLGEGLSRRGSSLPQLLEHQSTSADVRQQIKSVFERAVNLANDDSASTTRRVEGIGLLAFADFSYAARHLSSFLAPQVPQSLQRAAVTALGQHEATEASELLLREWKTYSPQIRRDVIDELISSPSRIDRLLSAVESKSVARSDIERDKKQLLVNHPNSRIRQQSRKLFGNDVNSDRARVVAQYQTVLHLDGNTRRGAEVFQKKCSTCHQVGDTGYRVAPDLVSVQNKSPGDLLVAILDPNREAQPNFNTYNVLTIDGKIYNGIIVAETANSITLRRAEAKEDVILRSTIESLISTGTSLMPEGLEKDLTPRDLADVISFVKQIKPDTASQAGDGL